MPQTIEWEVNDELDTMITNENVFGDTTLTITKSMFTGQLFGDVLIGKLYIVVGFSSTVFPTDSNLYFKYNIMGRISTSSDVTGFVVGTTHPQMAMMHTGRDLPLGTMRCYNLDANSLVFDGYDFGDIGNGVGRSSMNVDRLYISANIVMKVTR